MKILLVNPTFHTVMGIGSSYSEPLGIAYLAAVVKEHPEHEVEVLDAVGLAERFEKVGNAVRMGIPAEEVLERMQKIECDVIGISLIGTMYAEEILEFVRDVKSQHPDKPILVGGPHATFEWEQCFEKAPIDYIALGEAEGTIVDFLDALSGKKPLEEVQGLAFRDSDGKPVTTTPRAAMPIDELPWPARHLLPMKNYMRLKPYQYHMRKPVVSILTSRACPYKCTFCSTIIFWSNKWRGRDAVNVVDEIEYIVKTYGIREFTIQDDSFIVNRKRVGKICDEIIRRKLDILWTVPPGVTIWLLDEEFLKKMRDSGLYVIRPQIETGIEKSVEYINKPVDLEKAPKIIRIANKLGLWTQTNIIIGFHEETREDIEASIAYAESTGVDNIGYQIATPYTHTPMYEHWVDSGLVERGTPLNSNGYDTLHLTAQEIREIRDRAQRRYKWVRAKSLLNPRRFYEEFWPKVNSAEKMMFFIRRLAYGL